jgi:hypothetical protein
LELKDSKGPSISSFNSTVPTSTKTLEEIDVVNGKILVSKMARAIDGEVALDKDYYHFERKCFYFVRTQKENEKTKISIIDGAFFETVPKGYLFHQMLLNVYRRHLEKKNLQIPPKTVALVENALKCIDDQTIIAGSQTIEKASVRPRLRIMAEVHAEGNPHGSFYPEIVEGSFNLILKSTPETESLANKLPDTIKGIEVFPIFHKRNGKHIVFQHRTKSSLAGYL